MGVLRNRRLGRSRQDELEGRIPDRDESKRSLARAELYIFFRAVPLTVEHQHSERIAVSEQQNFALWWAVRFDSDTLFGDGDLGRDGGLPIWSGQAPAGASTHLHQFGNLDADDGEQEGRGPGSDGNGPGGMDRVPGKRQKSSGAVSDRGDGLAFAIAEHEALVAFQTSLAQPLSAAGTTVTRFLRRMVGATRGYPHHRECSSIPLATSAILATLGALTPGSGIVFDQRAARQRRRDPGQAGRGQKVWNIPNILTVFRICRVPLLVVVLLTEVPDKEYWGLGIFLLAALTDALDRIIARRTETITTTGAMLDPIADKLLMSAAFISLVELQQAPAWMVTLIVGREFAVTALRMIALERGIAISANWLGKAKTTVQIITVSILIFSLNSDRWDEVGMVGLWITVLLTVASMVVYFWQNRRVLMEDSA